MYIVNKFFIKNYYYNRTTLLKLIHLYNYLNDFSFTQDLSGAIISNHFDLNERKTEALFEIYSKLLPNITILDLNFGYVWIFEEKVIFYFKNDFDFNDFYFFFSNLKKDYNIEWGCIEFFDKNIKIFEIFSKNSLLRNFRDEILLQKNKNVLKGFTESFVDLEKPNFLFFLKEYNALNSKLVLYYYVNED